jgi:hypothetical protein
MAAYQVETELLGMLQDHYGRVDEEGRTLLHAAFQSPARVEVAVRWTPFFVPENGLYL